MPAVPREATRWSAFFLATASKLGLPYEFCSLPTLEALKQMLRAAGFVKRRRQTHAVDALAEEGQSRDHDAPAIRPRDCPRVLVVRLAVRSVRL